MYKFAQRIGALRLMLLLAALFSAASMFWVDTSMAPEGWGLLRAAVLPALAPIIFMVLILDLLMCQILKADPDIPVRRRLDLGYISKIHLLVAAILMVSWLAVFLQTKF